MNRVVPVLRRALVPAAAGALLLISAPGAEAAASPERTARPAQSTPAAGPLAAYRGIQGGNLCLLARCTVGDSGPAGHVGPSNTQGFNLCLLAVCTVRP
ncbi:hypothetical protein [Streptomyces microflavus]|uniref:hypothetical protein n=1 Tax=Streptomyces microflavus TaxID=1919 RepID=UPI0033BE86A5